MRNRISVDTFTLNSKSKPSRFKFTFIIKKSLVVRRTRGQAELKRKMRCNKKQVDRLERERATRFGGRGKMQEEEAKILLGFPPNSRPDPSQVLLPPLTPYSPLIREL